MNSLDSLRRLHQTMMDFLDLNKNYEQPLTFRPPRLEPPAPLPDLQHFEPQSQVPLGLSSQLEIFDIHQPSIQELHVQNLAPSFEMDLPQLRPLNSEPIPKELIPPLMYNASLENITTDEKGYFTLKDPLNDEFNQIVDFQQRNPDHWFRDF